MLHVRMHSAGAWAVNRDHLSDAAREALEHVMVCVDEPWYDHMVCQADGFVCTCVLFGKICRLAHPLDYAPFYVYCSIFDLPKILAESVQHRNVLQHKEGFLLISVVVVLPG